MSVLAEAQAQHGRLQEAEATIGDALALTTKNEDNWSYPEVLRIQAFVLAAQGRAQEQESVLVKSMEVAQQLGATSWRLRAAIDLARLWHGQSRTLDAKRLLQPVFDSFTDGFETRDLVAAAQLLSELQ